MTQPYVRGEHQVVRSHTPLSFKPYYESIARSYGET